MHVLITGAAGFIGYHLAKRLLEDGNRVTGIDNLSDYYNVQLKEDRLKQLTDMDDFSFRKMDIADGDAVDSLFSEEEFTHVVNLAAQAGVRYSLRNPAAYISSNIVGFSHILEGCRHYPVKHLVFASSSSVYGLNVEQPYSPHVGADHPVSLYAATKRSNELMAHSYSHLYAIPCTGLRFFTVYGPWGRPDMALDTFTRAILDDRPIKVFNNGHMRRDFTYVGDIIDGVVRVLKSPPKVNPDWDAARCDPAASSAPWRLLNIGNDQPIELGHYIATLEKTIGKVAKKDMLPMQEGDVLATWADVSDLEKLTGFRPATKLEDGIAEFWKWYQSYYLR